ncbi:GAF domain-containing protein, partial [Achromobacter insolitus]|uniref:GAF domain-containing protein n=1 Tax=Achromobacter insolitus TaxID=217204 RepID=UPI002FDE6FAB
MSGTRAGVIPTLDALARAHAEVAQPQAVYAAVDQALAAAIGHRLFTILSYDPRTGVATRLYSNLPETYPAGGSKTLAPGLWTETVLDRGEPYIGRTPADLQAAKDQNITILSYLANHFNVPMIAWMGPIVAMVAITKSFLGHYLGAR